MSQNILFVRRRYRDVVPSGASGWGHGWCHSWCHRREGGSVEHFSGRGPAPEYQDNPREGGEQC